MISDVQSKLLLAGFSETQVLQSTVSSGGKSAGVSFIIWYLPLPTLFIIVFFF